MIEELSVIAEGVGGQLQRLGHKLAVAESSTGGLLSAALLSIPGASAYFAGGLVVYTQSVRALLIPNDDPSLVGVRASTEQYALLLAAAVRQRLGATWGLAETGAAGPTGNRYGDAAGHCCIAVLGPRQRVITLETGKTDRALNMQEFATTALNTLALALAE